jgi:hypothetical protein
MNQRVLNDLLRARLSRGRMIWLLAHPAPLTNKLDWRHRERERQVADGRGEGGRGVGKEPNHMTARNPGPLSLIQYSLI